MATSIFATPWRRGLLGLGLLACLLLAPSRLAGQDPATNPAATNRPAVSAGFDPEAATEAYLARLSPEERERSDSYFEGGYWLQLWSFLYGLGVAWVLLASGLSTRMRDLAQRVTRFKFLQGFLYAVGYIFATTLLGLPLGIYAGFFREHKYGLSNQTFPEWGRDQLVGLALELVLGGLFLAVIYLVIRKAPRRWWIWCAGVAVLFVVFAMIITPVFINPLFNKYTRLTDAKVRDPILSLARANGIPAENVWVSDASKQSKRISANVAGFLGTERITLNDNLLNRSSLGEIEAVMGHEMGHYVLNHVYEMVVEIGLLIVLGAAFVAWAFGWAQKRWGAGWGIRGVDDPAGLPLLAALLSAFFFLATPVLNTIIRSNEAEADLFGLNAARQPDGFAEAALKLGEYRKLSPGPVEEFIFFDHPSGRNRILMSMRWKAEHQGDPSHTTAVPAAAGAAEE